MYRHRGPDKAARRDAAGDLPDAVAPAQQRNRDHRCGTDDGEQEPEDLAHAPQVRMQPEQRQPASPSTTPAVNGPGVTLASMSVSVFIASHDASGGAS